MSTIDGSQAGNVAVDLSASAHSELTEGSGDIVQLGSKDIQGTIKNTESPTNVESGGTRKRVDGRKADEHWPSVPPVARDAWRPVPVQATTGPLIVKRAFANSGLREEHRGLLEPFLSGAGTRAERPSAHDVPSTGPEGPSPSGSFGPWRGHEVRRPPAPSQPAAGRLTNTGRLPKPAFKKLNVDSRHGLIVHRNRNEAWEKRSDDPEDAGGPTGPTQWPQCLGPSVSGPHPRPGTGGHFSGFLKPPSSRGRTGDGTTPPPVAALLRRLGPPGSSAAPEFARSCYVPPYLHSPRALRPSTRTSRPKVPERASGDRAPERGGASFRAAATGTGPRESGRPTEAQRPPSRIAPGLVHDARVPFTDLSDEAVVSRTKALVQALARGEHGELRARPSEIKRLIERPGFQGALQDPPRGGPGLPGAPTWAWIASTHERAFSQRLEGHNPAHLVLAKPSSPPSRVERARGHDAPHGVRSQERPPLKRSATTLTPPSHPTTVQSAVSGAHASVEEPFGRVAKRPGNAPPSARKGAAGRLRPRGRHSDPPVTTSSAPLAGHRDDRGTRDRGPEPLVWHEAEPLSDRPANFGASLGPRQRELLAAQVGRVDLTTWYAPEATGGYALEQFAAPSGDPGVEYLGATWVPGPGGYGAYRQRWRFVDAQGFEHVGETLLPADPACLDRWRPAGAPGEERIGASLFPARRRLGALRWLHPAPDSSLPCVGTGVLAERGSSTASLGTVQAEPHDPDSPPIPALQ